jgi:hypothetical protein
MWTSGRNAIHYQDAFCMKGKSTDSAIFNPNRKEWATNEVPLKRPYFNSGEWPPWIGQANKKLLLIGILVSKDGNGKNYTGILVKDYNLKKALEIDNTLVESKTRQIIKDGTTTFEVYEFFTDNFVFHVMPKQRHRPKNCRIIFSK